MTEDRDVEGIAMFDNAIIRGEFVSTARFRRTSDTGGLSLAGTTIRGGATLDGIRSDATIVLRSSAIGGHLSLRSAVVTSGCAKALNAESIQVGGSVLLRAMKAEGEIDFSYSTIGKNIEFDEGLFFNSPYELVDLQGARVSQNVFVRNHVVLRGIVAANGAHIEHTFQWTEVLTPELTSLDLRGAHAGNLWDEESSWPPAGKIQLQEFTYDTLDDEAPASARSRIDWIQRQSESWKYVQPYDEAIKALKRRGVDTEWRDVGIAKEWYVFSPKDADWYSRVSRITWIALGWPIGYGYKPLRGLTVGFAVVIVGAVIFHIAHTQYNIVERRESKNAEPFSPLAYSLDLFVPLLKLYQEDNWAPRGSAYIIYARMHKISGWYLTTLVGAALTGLVRH